MTAAADELLFSAFDALLQRYARGAFEPEIVRAREEFTDRTGRFFEEDELYEMRTSAFLEWYAIERPLGNRAPAGSTGLAPVRVALRQTVAAPASDARDAGAAVGDASRLGVVAGDAGAPAAGPLRAWAASHRSLFAIVGFEQPAAEGGIGRVRLHDLVNGGRFEVEEHRRLDGVTRGDIVEARLLGWRGRVVFGRTFLFHPVEAREAILAQAQRIRGTGGSRADIVDEMARLRMKAERFKHVAAARVYETGPVPRS